MTGKKESESARWARDNICTFVDGEDEVALETLRHAIDKAAPCLKSTGEVLRQSLSTATDVLALQTRAIAGVWHNTRVLSDVTTRVYEAWKDGVPHTEKLITSIKANALSAIQTMPSNLIDEAIELITDVVSEWFEPQGGQATASRQIAEATAKAYEALLRQGVVLIWGAVDAFASDLLQEVVTQEPSLARKLEGNIRGKLGEAAMKVVLGQGLGPSDMARLAFENAGLEGSRKRIRDTYKHICPDAEGRISFLFDGADVQSLESQRHAIIHRGGTGVAVTTADIAKYLRAAADIGEMLLDACSAVVA